MLHASGDATGNQLALRPTNTICTHRQGHTADLANDVYKRAQTLLQAWLDAHDGCFATGCSLNDFHGLHALLERQLFEVVQGLVPDASLGYIDDPFECRRKGRVVR